MLKNIILLVKVCSDEVMTQQYDVAMCTQYCTTRTSSCSELTLHSLHNILPFALSSICVGQEGGIISLCDSMPVLSHQNSARLSHLHSQLCHLLLPRKLALLNSPLSLILPASYVAGPKPLNLMCSIILNSPLNAEQKHS